MEGFKVEKKKHSFLALYIILIAIFLALILSNIRIKSDIDSALTEKKTSAIEERNLNMWLALGVFFDQLFYKTKDGSIFRTDHPIVNRETLDKTFDNVVKPDKVSNFFGVPTDGEVSGGSAQN